MSPTTNFNINGENPNNNSVDGVQIHNTLTKADTGEEITPAIEAKTANISPSNSAKQLYPSVSERNSKNYEYQNGGEEQSADDGSRKKKHGTKSWAQRLGGAGAGVENGINISEYDTSTHRNGRLYNYTSKNSNGKKVLTSSKSDKKGLSLSPSSVSNSMAIYKNSQAIVSQIDISQHINNHPDKMRHKANKSVNNSVIFTNPGPLTEKIHKRKETE